MTNSFDGKKRTIIFAGVDDGYAETKISLSNGVNIKIPSQAKAGESTQIALNGNAKTIYSYSTDEGQFIIGDIRESDPTEFDGYPLSAMNRVIVSHALRKAGVTGEYDVYVCSGLPIKKYYLGGKANINLINKKKENLLRNDVETIGDDSAYQLCRIKRHDVLPEGIAAYMDLVLYRNDDGKIVKSKKVAEQRIAIIDIGGRTTDIAVIQDSRLDSQRSSTIEVGMLAVRDAVRAAIQGSFEIEPSSEMLNDAIATRIIKMWGTGHDVDELVETAIKSTVLRIHAEVKKCLKEAVDIDRVVFVGGTVMEIRGHLDGWFKNQEFGVSPPFANAHGMQKYAESLMTTDR